MKPADLIFAVLPGLLLSVVASLSIMYRLMKSYAFSAALQIQTTAVFAWATEGIQTALAVLAINDVLVLLRVLAGPIIDRQHGYAMSTVNSSAGLICIHVISILSVDWIDRAVHPSHKMRKQRVRPFMLIRAFIASRMRAANPCIRMFVHELAPLPPNIIRALPIEQHSSIRIFVHEPVPLPPDFLQALPTRLHSSRFDSRQQMLEELPGHVKKTNTTATGSDGLYSALHELSDVTELSEASFSIGDAACETGLHDSATGSGIVAQHMECVQEGSPVDDTMPTPEFMTGSVAQTKYDEATKQENGRDAKGGTVATPPSADSASGRVRRRVKVLNRITAGAVSKKPRPIWRL